MRFFGIGAYISAILTIYGLNPWGCHVESCGASLRMAILVGAPSLRLKGHYLAMATLAFGIIIYIIFNEETQWTGGAGRHDRHSGIKPVRF